MPNAKHRALIPGALRDAPSGVQPTGGMLPTLLIARAKSRIASGPLAPSEPGRDRGHREVARPVLLCAKPIADGGLTFGQAVEVAHASEALQCRRSGGDSSQIKPCPAVLSQGRGASHARNRFYLLLVFPNASEMLWSSRTIANTPLRTAVKATVVRNVWNPLPKSFENPPAATWNEA